MQTTKMLLPNEQLIHITESYVDVLTLDDKGVGNRGKISHDDFTTLLSASTKTINTQKMSVYELGPNVIKFRHSKDGFVYYFLSRKGKYPFNNHGKRLNIHYPNVLFKFLLNKEKELKSTEVYVIKEEDLNVTSSWGVQAINIADDTQLYKYPWGNVRDDGSLCWGSNSFQKLDNYMVLNEVVSSFYEASTNRDYTKGIFREIETRTELIKKFKSEPFNEDLLKPSKLYNNI